MQKSISSPVGAPVDRRDDDAGELAGPVEGRRLPAILQHGEQMIAGLESEIVERRQRARKSCRTIAA